MSMTPEAKKLLPGTIRALRARLLADLAGRTMSTYQLGLRAQDANLDEEHRCKRRRLERYLDEQVRAQPGRSERREAADFLREVEQTAAYTLLNRLVVLRIMEATELRRQPLLTLGWSSTVYKTFRDLAPELRDDETEGYELLLRLVFDELAGELPGLYGPAGPGGVADLIPVPASTLRHVIEALDQPGLASCWTDDMTLGWIYQYWNDPVREALDVKIRDGGRIAPHEIASKTQMFTERYMVDWLLQNSLGPLWLAMCKKHGWTAEVEADGTLARLEARRVDWRARRDRGEVPLTELMPLHTDAERRWAYYVPQPIPEDAVANAPASVRDLKILDPAVGSGHFLVAAFELLVALYREEARHSGEEEHERWTDRAIVEHILGDNLHGIDLDPRAVQIAAAALWLKAQQTCRGAHPRTLHLVASNLRLASLPKDDPDLVELRQVVERETSIPAELTDKVVAALAGADHLGSLLQVDRAVEEAIDEYEEQRVRQFDGAAQGGLFTGFAQPQQALLGREVMKVNILDRLEEFLKRHSGGDDLGLRLHGEQLAAGVRFVRMVREGTYDLVIGNPPYQGTAKMQDVRYVQRIYGKGKADLYAAFLIRGLQLAREGGMSALLTMRNWMFIKQYKELRAWLLSNHDLRAIGDFAIGAFDEVPNDVLSVVVSVFRKADPVSVASVAAMPSPIDDRSYDRERTQRKRAATLAQIGRHEFVPTTLKVVPEWPLVYWWSPAFRARYVEFPKLGESAQVRNGMSTQNNERFLRSAWEILPSALYLGVGEFIKCPREDWALYIKGGEGRAWLEDARDAVRWTNFALEVKVFNEQMYGAHSRTVKNEALYFRLGVAFTLIGNTFAARSHRYRSVFGHMGASVFPGEAQRSDTTCLLNSASARQVLYSLNPSLHFLVGDVNRLPLFPIDGSNEVFATLERAFTAHESHREPSIEFRRPGPSPWRHAQGWAQQAVDRPEGYPLPAYEEGLDPEPAIDHLSFALGVALGRYGPSGEGILVPARDDLSHALPAGILFINTTLDSNDLRDSLRETAARPLLDAWRQYGPEIKPGGELRDFLATEFFEHHRKQYENRPIHWPLSSEQRSFVAWVTIHRWDASTLRVLLADHLQPALNDIEGELRDIRAAQVSGDKKAVKAAEKRLAKVKAARVELQEFIAAVEQCAEKGPPPPDPKRPEREVDARYDPDLDDGVMINAAALWPLFPVKQWKEPRKWWKELASPDPKKNYDWSHLAMRYWPTRVDERCRIDPSLAVAHGCFWRYHPPRAWAWELRLQDEIGPEFRIVEDPYRGDGGHEAHRSLFLLDHPVDALAIVEKEILRRTRKQQRFQEELRLLEPGLWSAVPDQCWALELRIIKRYRKILQKQLLGSVWGELKEFCLLAPDEVAARTEFMADNPRPVRRRQQLLEAALDFVFDDEDDDLDAEEVEADSGEAEDGDDE